VKSPVGQIYKVKKFRDFMNKLKVVEHNAIIFYQRRKNFFSCPTRNRKSTMSAGVTGSQNFAKVVCWLFTWSAQLCWKVCLFLLLLKTRHSKMIVLEYKHKTHTRSYHLRKRIIQDSEVAKSSEHILHQSRYLPEYKRNERIVKRRIECRNQHIENFKTR